MLTERAKTALTLARADSEILGGKGDVNTYPTQSGSILRRVIHMERPYPNTVVASDT